MPSYLPPSRGSNNVARNEMSLFFTFLKELRGESVIGADFNAHHTSWSPEFTTCIRGRLLFDLIADSNLILLNDGSPTMISSPGGRNSAIDVTLVTPGLARKSAWSVKEEEFGSSHMCISLDISSEIPKVERTVRRINWEKLVNHLNEIRPQFMYSPEEMVLIFVEAVEESSYSFKNKKANFLKTWWTEEIACLYESKRAALRTYNKQKTSVNFIRLQKERALFKRVVRRTKRSYVRELTEKINETTPPRQLWNMVKGMDTALTGRHKKGIEITREEGLKFMDHYFKDKYQEIAFPSVSTEGILEGYEMAIKDEEILSVLQDRKTHSTAGPNGMSYAVLKQLNTGMQRKICEMLSRVFVSEEIPDQWRVAEIRPIPKKSGKTDTPHALMIIEIKLINAPSTRTD